jgi:lysozyme
MTVNLKVLDLSHHNDGPNGGPIDFDRIASFGIKGIIHKATQGTVMVDKMYGLRIPAIVRANLLPGAYHFGDSSDPQDQADHFLHVTNPGDNMLVALDFEPNGNNTMTLDSAREFLHAIEKFLGRKAVLYSGNLIKETLGDNTDAYLSAHRLWLAQYGPVPKVPAAWNAPWLWQFSGDGINNQGINIPGVNASQASQLDMNSYYGSDDDLTSEWAS